MRSSAVSCERLYVQDAIPRCRTTLFPGEMRPRKSMLGIRREERDPRSIFEWLKPNIDSEPFRFKRLMSRVCNAAKPDGADMSVIGDNIRFDVISSSVTELSKPAFLNACITEQSSHAVFNTGPLASGPSFFFWMFFAIIFCSSMRDASSNIVPHIRTLSSRR